MEFSKDIQEILTTKYPDKDMYSMSLDELKAFKIEIEDLRHEYSLIELANKTLGNAAYGACASPFCYFFNVNLAGDITGECRHLTQTMITNLENFFHEEIWNRKDLWEKFEFKLDETKKEWYKERPVWVYSDTDSLIYNSLINVNDKNITIQELYNKAFIKNGKIDDTLHEIVSGEGFDVLNFKDNKIVKSPIKYVIRHKVSKAKWKIKTKSGKEIIVTGDHSCIVFRDGKQITIKAKDINKNTDKILSINA